jgi:hypothetical protein
MNNAKKQAVDLAKQTIEDFKGMVSVGEKQPLKKQETNLSFKLSSALFLS